jgi:uncharacterized protein (DUF885 family)
LDRGAQDRRVNRRGFVAGAGAGIASATLAGCQPRQPRAPTAFEGFLADAAHELIGDAPEFAAQAGLSAQQAGGAYADRLDDRSAGAVDLRRAAALRRLAQWRGLTRDRHSPEDETTAEVLDAQFSAMAAGARFSYGRFAPLCGFSPYVVNHIDSAFVSLPDFFSAYHGVPTLDDARAYVTRLKAVAGALDAEGARARTDAALGVVAPDFVLERAQRAAQAILDTAPAATPFVAALRGRLETLVGPLDSAVVAIETPERAHARNLIAAAEAIAANDIAPAFRRTAALIAELRARAGHDVGVWRLPDGEAYYRASLGLHLTRPMSAEALHRLGLERVARVTGELDMMLRSQGLAEGAAGERLAKLTVDPRFHYPNEPDSRARVLGDFVACQQRAAARLARWFASPPELKLIVRAMADTTPASFLASYQAPPLDGSQPGVALVNLRDPSAPARFDLATLAHHEGLPGHHLQTAAARRRADLPVLRRLLSFSAFAEGWATYAEGLADEMGLYDDDPYGRLGYLRWQAWRAARLVVDTGIHALRWSKEQAAAYLLQVTGDAPGLIEDEIARYVTAPGQACAYEIGRAEIVRLRDRARTGLGGRFDIRNFHDVVLRAGETPLDTLARRVESWIAGGGAARS